MAVDALERPRALATNGRTGSRFPSVPVVAFLAAALVAAAVMARTQGVVGARFAAGELAFVSLFAESLPFLLIGAALSALLTGRAGARLLQAADDRPRLAAALAPLVGAALPLCDCGLLPLARRLRNGRAGRAAGSFLAGAPLTNPIVVVSTLLAFPGEPGMAVARVLGGLAMAMAVSAFVAAPKPSTCDIEAHEHDEETARPGWSSALAGELARTGPVLVLGALAAASLKAALPTSAFLSLANQPLLGALAMMALAFVMSICSQADAFVAASLPVGALPRLGFLLLGPVFDLRLATLYRREFGTSWVLRYGAVVLPVAILVATACATAGLV